LEYIIIALSWLGRLALYATFAFAALFLLRVILAWAGVNPFARIPYHLTRITEPMVRPLRYQFSGRSTQYDLLPLVAGILVFFVGTIIAAAIWQVAAILSDIYRALTFGLFDLRFALKMLVLIIGNSYILAFLLRFILPFLGVGYSNRFMRFLFKITEPLLKPLRRYLTFGMFDLSPMVVLLLVRLVMGIIVDLLGG
jgi:YggT family protein